jgi:hypothetical protein
MLRHDAGHQAQRRRQEHMYTKIGASTRAMAGCSPCSTASPRSSSPFPLDRPPRYRPCSCCALRPM